MSGVRISEMQPFPAKKLLMLAEKRGLAIVPQKMNGVDVILIGLACLLAENVPELSKFLDEDG